MTDSVLPPRTSVAVIGILLFDGIIDAIECHSLCRSAQNGTADDGSERVARLGVAIGETSQVVGASGMSSVHRRGRRGSVGRWSLLRRWVVGGRL